jgi:2,3-bisphosphoglycerate-dependent phosphoglycerate mutase
MLLYLIRHGESTHNAEGRIQGQSDASLSELGRRQGQAAAEALRSLPIDAVFSSPLRRAKETAQAIASPHHLPVQTDPRWMELNVGVFQDRLKTELAEAYPVELTHWLSGDEDFVIPGGESRRQLAARGRDAMRSVVAAGPSHAVIVTHGGLLSATLRNLLNLTEPLPPFSIQNGSITRLAVDSEGRFTLLALNETAHLDSVGVSDGGDL